METNNIDNQELSKMLKETEEKELQERKALVGESKGEEEAKRLAYRLFATKKVLLEMLRSGDIKPDASFNKATAILDSIFDSLQFYKSEGSTGESPSSKL